MLSSFLARKRLVFKFFILIAFFYNFYRFFNAYNPYLIFISNNSLFGLKEMHRLFIDDRLLRLKIFSVFIKNILILSPIIISVIKKNYYFFITYLISFILSVNFVRFININLTQDYDIFIAIALLGNFGIAKLIGNTVISNLSFIPLLYGFSIQVLSAKNINLNFLVLNLTICAICFVFCFKIENLFRKTRFEKK